MTTTLYIVPCGKAKIWDKHPHRGPTPASEAYTGSFATAARAYALSTLAPWVILSAKYGFLWPSDDVPGPYETTFVRPSADTITVERLREQVREKNLVRFDEVVVIAGRAYADKTRGAFASSGAAIRIPLAGVGGMGRMIAALKQARESRLLL